VAAIHGEYATLPNAIEVECAETACCMTKKCSERSIQVYLKVADGTDGTITNLLSKSFCAHHVAVTQIMVHR
jgi:hypothetical protein